MKKVLAVSGGVDSMVMLDFLVGEAWAGGESLGELVVAHFNHGMRENSGEDAEFVQQRAAEYGVEFRSGRGELGSGAGEATARAARYEFLRDVAEELGGEIYVAQHADDVVESVVINLLRGTGWRGLAPMSDERIVRPLLGWSKRQIWRYAAEHEIRWRQDQSNTEGDYLRNRVRECLVNVKSDFSENRAGVGASSRATALSSSHLSSQVAKSPLSSLLTLAKRQRKVATEVDSIVGELLPADGHFERGWFQGLDDDVAMEILRAGLLRVGVRATRPQLAKFLAALRDYENGKSFNLAGDYLVKMGRELFVLK